VTYLLDANHFHSIHNAKKFVIEKRPIAFDGGKNTTYEPALVELFG
jgi:hypothetical protein